MRFSKVGGGTIAAIVSALIFAAPGAGMASTVAPSITVNPNNVMVNTDTTVIGKHFTPGATYMVVECSKKSWVVPVNPCDTDNTLTVTANRLGNFKAPMKVEICPGGTFNPPYGEACYIGLPQAQRYRHGSGPVRRLHGHLPLSGACLAEARPGRGRQD